MNDVERVGGVERKGSRSWKVWCEGIVRKNGKGRGRWFNELDLGSALFGRRTVEG